VIRENAPQTLIRPPPPQAILATDAVEPGWGAELTLISAPSLIQQLVPNLIHPLAQQYNRKSNLLSVNYPLMAYGRWKENVSHQSSNRRELVAIHQVLKAFAPGKQDQINQIVFRQRHSSLQIESKSCGDNIIQEPSQTIIVNNYYGSEYSCGTLDGYLQRSCQLSESLGISRRLLYKQGFTFCTFDQVGCFPGHRPFCNIFDSFMQEFLFHKKRPRSRGLSRKCNVYQFVGYDLIIHPRYRLSTRR
jgi:hypothetical protein